MQNRTHAGGVGAKPARAASPILHPWMAMLLITAAAAALRFWRLGTAGLWVDEAASYVLARMPLGDLLTRNLDHGNPPFYYAALGAWMRCFGTSEAAMRSLSAVAGTLSIPVIYLLGKELLGRRTGLATALLLALSPYHVHYSQEARQYPLAMLLGMLSVWQFARALRTGRPGAWAAAAIFAALGFYVHFSVLLVAAFEAVYLLYVRRSAEGWRAGLLFALLCLPGVALFFAPTFLAPAGYTFWQARATPIELLKALDALFGWPVPSQAPAPLLGAGVALLAAAALYPILRAVAAGRSEQGAVRPLHFAAGYLLVPLLLLTAAARVKPIWQERYLVVAFPGLLLVCGWAVAELRGRGRMLLTAALAAITATALFFHVVRPPFTAWRNLASAIEASGGRSGEIFLTPPFMSSLFDYYYRGPLPRRPFPAANGPIGAAQIRPLSDTGAAELAAEASGRATLFLIYQSPVPGDPGFRLARRILESRGPGRTRSFQTVRVFAFGKGAAAFGGDPVTAQNLAELTQ